MVWVRLTTTFWALLVGALLLLPGESLPSRFALLEWLEGWFDKAVHYALFAILAGLGTLSLGRRRTEARAVAGVVVLTAAYGVGLELAQGEVAGRSLEGLDLVANLLGALSGPSMALRAAASVGVDGERHGRRRDA